MLTLLPIRTLTGHSAAIYSVIPGRKEHTVFSASGDRFVAEWDTLTGMQEPFAVRLEHPAFSICLVREYGLLFVGNSVGGIHVIDLAARQEVRYLVQHTNGIYDIVWDAATGQLVAAGGDGVMSVWNLPGPDLALALPLTTEKLRQVAFSPDSTALAVAAGDGMIRLLDTTFFNEHRLTAQHPGGATSVAFHPARQALLSGGKDAMLRVHALAGGHEVLAVPAHNFAIYSIAFSPDHALLATASRDKTVKLWDASTLHFLARLEARDGGHAHSVNKLTWMDNQHLVTCSDDRRMLLLEVQSST
ncbi:MAG: WD40 repeat domain-containing protein [Flavobacteriales bacterium]|jgi:WD40 repeat protein